MDKKISTETALGQYNAAYAVSQGFPLKRTYTNYYGRFWYVFENSPELQQCLEEKNNDESIGKFIDALIQMRWVYADSKQAQTQEQARKEQK